MHNIAVLVSGGGTNLQALLDRRGEIESCGGAISLVLSSSAKAYALERAKGACVPTVTLSPRDYASNTDYTAAVTRILKERGVALVVLAGFMHILGSELTNAYAGRIVNVHPSLLPAFGGKGFYGLRVHRAALERGVKVTGATVHLVNDECDGGDIIAQKAIEVPSGITPEELQRLVMRECEHVLLPRAVCELCGALTGNSS